MHRIKLFEGKDKEGTEAEVNEWLEKNEKSQILEIRFECHGELWKVLVHYLVALRK